MDKELVKENYKEKGKVVDLNVKIGKHLLVTVEMNRFQYENVKLRNYIFLEKLHTMQYEVNDEYKALKSIYLYQLYLNVKDNYHGKGENIIVSYDITDHRIFNDNVKTYIKHLEYYKNMFYTNNNLMEFDEIFMAGLMAKNFYELYSIMRKILSKNGLSQFMESLIHMSNDSFILHEWAKEEMDKLVQDTAKEIGYHEGREKGMKKGMEEGRKEGIQQNTNDIIKKMLDKKMDIDLIADITGTSIEEVKKFSQNIN